jgi:hypothetical protein
LIRVTSASDVAGALSSYFTRSPDDPILPCEPVASSQ